MPPPLQITERRIGDLTVLTLAGRLILDEGDLPLPKRIDALIHESRIDIVLNLHDVVYMDSCGVGALVAEYVSLRRRGGHLKLVCPSARCSHVLAITHLLPIFEIYQTEDDAIRSFANAGAGALG